MLLTLAAAPLLVLGAPPLVWLHALPTRPRRSFTKISHYRRLTVLTNAVTLPVVVWALAVGALYAWHIPELYQLALTNEPVHVVEHWSFVATALLFWWMLLDRQGRHRLGAGAGILFAFAMAYVLIGAGLFLAWFNTIRINISRRR